MFFTVGSGHAPAFALAYIGNSVKLVWLSVFQSGGFMREKVVEQRLIKAVRQSGGLALKLISPGFNGVPDRLLLFPGRANLLRPPVADASQEVRSDETSELPCGESRRLSLRNTGAVLQEPAIGEPQAKAKRL